MSFIRIEGVMIPISTPSCTRPTSPAPSSWLAHTNRGSPKRQAMILHSTLSLDGSNRSPVVTSPSNPPSHYHRKGKLIQSTTRTSTPFGMAIIGRSMGEVSLLKDRRIAKAKS